MSRKCFALFLLSVVLFLPATATALTELSGRIRQDAMLRMDPLFESEMTETEVKEDESTLVLGNSVDGDWIKVMTRNGEQGWIQEGLVDLRRVPMDEFDEYFYMLRKKNRTVHRWNYELGLSWGTAPFGIGVENMIRLNLYEDGIFIHRGDVFELGTGFRYHKGADPSPAIGATDLVNQEGKAFWEVPLEFTYLFRIGVKGDLMAGPHFGVSFVNDPFARFTPSMPAVLGAKFRYYPGDSFGLYWNTWMHLRSVTYYGLSFGVNWRF